jgi:hypothetical protein
MTDFAVITPQNGLALYTDRYGRIHDKPVEASRPSSNNGWLYSAVAQKLGADVWIEGPVAELCARMKQRHPYGTIDSPPISRDEILGLASLGYLKEEHLKGWSFSPFYIPPFILSDFVSQVLALVDWKEKKLKHRNTFWKEHYRQIYRLAFKVPLSDRFFLQMCWGKYSFVYHFIHIVAHWKQPTNRSSRLLRFLKTGKDKEAVVNYFGAHHPLSKYVR